MILDDLNEEKKYERTKNIMKKIFAIFLVIIMMLSMCACGNYDMWDTTYKYDYAIIQLPNGEIVEGEVERWTDYEGEQLQITIDGKTYLVSSFNAVMISNEG